MRAYIYIHLYRGRYKNLAEIQGIFIKDAVNKCPHIESDIRKAWGLEDSAPEPDSAEPQREHSSGLLSTADASSAQQCAMRNGFEIGKLYYEKVAPGTLYSLAEFKDGAVFKLVDIWGESTAESSGVKTTSYGQLKELWACFKGSKPERLESAALRAEELAYKKTLMQQSSLINVYAKLVESAAPKGLSMTTELDYALNPHEVRVKIDIKKNDLILFPVTDLSKITVAPPDKIASALVAKCQGIAFSLAPPAKLKSADDLAKDAHGRVVPFWWVTPTQDEAMANMTQKTKSLGDGVQVPILVNERALEANSKLYFYKSISKKAPQAFDEKPKEDEDKPNDEDKPKEADEEAKPAKPASKRQRKR